MMGTAKQGWKVCQQGIGSASVREEGRLMRRMNPAGDAPDESGWGARFSGRWHLAR
jgi:hypothetical protein